MKSFVWLIFGVLVHSTAFGARPEVKGLSFCRDKKALQISFESYESDFGHGVTALMISNPRFSPLDSRYGDPGIVLVETGALPETSMGFSENVWTPIRLELKFSKTAPGLIDQSRYEVRVRSRGDADLGESSLIAVVDLRSDTVELPDGGRDIVKSRCK